MLNSLLRLVPKFTRLSLPSKPHEPTAVTRSLKGLQLRLRVKPNSTTDRVLNLRKDCLHIAVTQAAQKDEANRGVIDLMSMVLAVRKSEISIVTGQKSRNKVILVCLPQRASNEHGTHDDLAEIVKKIKDAIPP